VRREKGWGGEAEAVYLFVCLDSNEKREK
jgi:hypothetical protein